MAIPLIIGAVVIAIGSVAAWLAKREERQRAEAETRRAEAEAKKKRGWWPFGKKG